MAMRIRRQKQNNGGFTLFEMMMTLTIFSIIFSSLALVVTGIQTSYDRGSVESALRESGRRILKEIIHDLRQTGIIESGGVNLPAIYVREVLPPEETERGDLIATMSFDDVELGGQASRGRNRVETHGDRLPNEIVFKRLADLDNNGYPFEEDTGILEWTNEEFSYYVIEDVAGVPQLVRESTDGDFRIIGRDVEKVVFDVISYDPTVLYNQIVIVIYMTSSLPNGDQLRVGLEGTVNLRNTRELEG